ncbi:hypothetical protein GBA63_12075 [Rubrobacter tropicus]|uniref:FAD-binding FR-type domain-containing protein n=1 Tax=Rubrobacter tropicus TaxID=2653851 RepID=A0A6G8Q9X7_9ACTN|nr:FAD-binding oxidoreductase [Rubrobacter tropicus]QIN83294.1 hypothetical protein GBA63_12075 [Rubrobacter tropicus]
MAAAQPRGISWRLAEVVDVVPETPRTKSLVLAVPGWEGHRAGQHVDVRLTAPDGYRAQRSYSIASAPEDGGRLVLTVDRLEDGEVSPYLTDVLVAGDRLELRGPVGGYFVWETADGGPLLLVGGGSGVVPLMAMIRHREAAGGDVPTRLLLSSRSYEDIIYRKELEDLAAHDGSGYACGSCGRTGRLRSPRAVGLIRRERTRFPWRSPARRSSLRF